ASTPVDASLRLPTEDASSGRCVSTSERSSLAPEHVPGSADVVLGRPEVPDRETQLVATREARVGEEDLARVVHPLEQALVVLVGPCPPEADEREVPRGRDFPARLVTHPALEDLCQAYVLSQSLLQAGAPVAPKHRPQLEGTEATAQRNRDLAQVHGLI